MPQDHDRPKLQRVSSSSIRAVGYDDEHGRLFLEYTNGGRYVHFGVPASVYRDLLAAESIGAYVNRVIKPRYPVGDADS
ncbi:KTSC domain-containing protein [Microlunatus speluncae]|uniref:KTSC domain-containing protein n=1 Tax=Microlunatus speluncae TaxID=2594267 RepID=UPI00126660BD|nr:KTSC domain-containing protein [Microlunatus speluncae]